MLQDCKGPGTREDGNYGWAGWGLPGALGSFPAGMRCGKAEPVKMWMQMQDATPCTATDGALRHPRAWCGDNRSLVHLPSPPGSCHFTSKMWEIHQRGWNTANSWVLSLPHTANVLFPMLCREPGCPADIIGLKNCLKRKKKKSWGLNFLQPQKAKLVLAALHSPTT